MAILTVRRAVILVIALTVFAYLDQVKHHAYVFDQDKLHSIAKETLKKNHTTTSELIHDLVKRLDRYVPIQTTRPSLVPSEIIRSSAPSLMSHLL